MSWVASAAIVASSLIGGSAAQSAADKQASAANNATALQKQMFDTTYAGTAPYRDAGAAATSKLSDLLGTSGNTGSAGYGSLTGNFTGQDYLNNQDPGYQFQLDQGQKALQNSQAASGGVLSGSALKGLIDYNQGVASTGYQNAWNRWNTQQGNTFSRLSSLASTGENAAVNAANTGAQTGAGMAGTTTQAGNAAAAGTMALPNSLTSGLNAATGYNMNQQWLSAMNPATNPYSPAAYSGATNTGYAATPNPAP